MAVWEIIPWSLPKEVPIPQLVSVLWTGHSHEGPKPKQLVWVKSHHVFTEGRSEERPFGQQGTFYTQTILHHTARVRWLYSEDRYNLYALKFIYMLLRLCMVALALMKMRSKNSAGMSWAGLHLSSIQAVPPSKHKGTRSQTNAETPALPWTITILLLGTDGKGAVSWPWLLPGAAQSLAAHSHGALLLQMPAMLVYSGAPARNPPTLLAPFFNIMSVCYKPVKPASSPVKALRSYRQKYSSLLFLPAFSKGEFCFAPFFKPATCHTAMTSCKSIG